MLRKRVEGFGFTQEALAKGLQGKLIAAGETCMIFQFTSAIGRERAIKWNEGECRSIRMPNLKLMMLLPVTPNRPCCEE